MKTSSTAIAFFFFNLSLNSSSDVWAKLRNSAEEHRELNHKSTNYFQSKLKNEKSGKCLGFEVANDVDDGDVAKWVNCKRAPTFEYQNPQDEIYYTQDEDEKKFYNGRGFHLTFIVGSLSDSSSTSDFRQYKCLEGSLKKGKGVTANKCNDKAEQYWAAIAVRGKRDTWRFKNSDTKGLIEYLEVEDEEDKSFNLFDLNESLNIAFLDASEFLNGPGNNRRTLQNAISNNVNPRAVFSGEGFSGEGSIPGPAQPIQLVDSGEVSTDAEELAAELLRDGEHEDEDFVKMTSVVSNNGTIYEYTDNAQYFTGLDCRFVFGRDPIRDDGWYNGVDPTSTKPPQEK